MKTNIYVSYVLQKLKENLPLLNKLFTFIEMLLKLISAVLVSYQVVMNLHWLQPPTLAIYDRAAKVIQHIRTNYTMWEFNQQEINKGITFTYPWLNRLFKHILINYTVFKYVSLLISIFEHKLLKLDIFQTYLYYIILYLTLMPWSLPNSSTNV